MSHFPFVLKEHDLQRLGLIVLQVDETIEHDFRQLFPPDIARLNVSRVPSGAELTPDSIAMMETTLPAAASLLPSTVPISVVGYGCTSGTALIGAARMSELIHGATQTDAVTDPLTSAFVACNFLKLGRIGIVSPYISSVAEPIRRAFEDKGINVADALSFGEEVESRVARIAPASVTAAARELARRSNLDGMFVSCTNLRTLDILGPLQAELGLPVLSSNQVLAWHMAALAGLKLRHPSQSLFA